MLKIKKFLKEIISIFNFSSKIKVFDEADVTFDDRWTLQTESTFYLVKQGKMCYCGIQVKLKGSTTSSTILTLPTECRPLYLQSFVIHGNATRLGEVVIYPTGEVCIYNYGTTSSDLTGAAYIALSFCYAC